MYIFYPPLEALNTVTGKPRPCFYVSVTVIGHSVIP